MGDWIPMEITRKKEISLSTFFLRFLCHTVLSVLIVMLLWFVLLELSITSGILLPANQIEQDVRSFTNRLGTHTIVTADMIPGGADYAIYDKDAVLQETNLSGTQLEDAGLFAVSGQEALKADLTGRVYLKQETDTQILILTYRIRSAFADSTLRSLFPDAEILELMFFVLLLVADLILVITCHAKKLSKELLVMQNAADQIRRQNLDFAISRTRIREFNQVIASLDALKTELSHSLAKQWHIQQQKKQQMSALAHDIKTPLTIVRGNAELLTETDLDVVQSSYNDFILKNTKQIEDYVTRLIEVSKDTAASAHTSHSDNQADAANAFCDSAKDAVLFADFLDTLCENTKSLGQKKELNIQFLSEALPNRLPFPEDSMKRILTNLLDNAVFYSPCNGTVTLHICTKSTGTASHTDLLVMEILDEGCGFSAEALCLGTEEFYQSDESRNSRVHFGMGLAITKQLVTALGGTLCLGNRPSGGAIVTVELPFS